MEKHENDYELYLKRFCENNHIKPEEAEQLAIVKEMKQYYEEGDNQ